MLKITTEEYHLIEEMVKTGQTNKQIASRLGWHVRRVEKWRFRLNHHQGLGSMGRPKKGHLDGFPSALRDLIKKWRGNYAGWGSITMHTELLTNGKWSLDKLPSPSSIHRFLDQEGFVKRYESHSDLSVFPKLKAEAPHDIWQMDAQGNERVSGVGIVSMLNVKDVFTGVHVSIYPASMKNSKNHPTTADYQNAFRLGAINHGLPRQVQTDHASVFFDNNSKSPFPTQFFLWLIALGIQPIFSRVHIPQDQAKVERTHRTAWNLLNRKQPYNNWQHFFEHCQQRREWSNQHRPCASLDGKPPLVVFPLASHSQKPFGPTKEPLHIQMDKVFEYLEGQLWWRTVSKDQTISIGSQVYYLSGAPTHKKAMIRFRKTDQSFLITVHDTLCFKHRIKNMTIQDLIGEVSLPFPGVQLKLFH